MNGEQTDIGYREEGYIPEDVGLRIYFADHRDRLVHTAALPRTSRRKVHQHTHPERKFAKLTLFIIANETNPT